MVDKKIFGFLGILSVAFVLMIIDISTPTTIIPPILKFVILLLALFFNLLALSTRFYSYLIIPMIKQRSRRIVLSNEDPYWIATSADSILRKEGDEFIATVYVKIPVYRSATEMTPEEKLDFTRQNSRLVALSREPTRFTAELRVMNKDSYLQIIRDMLNESQNEENKLVEQNAPETDLERARGKSTMWTNMLDVISKTPSLEMGTYATVSGIGTQEFEAVGQAQQRARELMSGVASLFGVTPSIVTGDMLLRFVEPEYMIPYSTITEQIAKGIREQMIK